MRKINKGDRALVNVLRLEKNWSSQRSLRKFSGRIGRKDKHGTAAEENFIGDRTSERR